MPLWTRHIRGKRTPKFRWVFACLAVIAWLLPWRPTSIEQPGFSEHAPLVRTIIDYGKGRGGRWHIPPSWLDFPNVEDFFDFKNLSNYIDLRNPRTPAEAAHLALDLAMREKRYLANTKIPLIVHQTWKDVDSWNWPKKMQDDVNTWIDAAMGDELHGEPEMTYIMWDDQGIDEFLHLYQNKTWNLFEMLPLKVEKADVFRVAVLQWFGGIYADVDTRPLQHPNFWVQDEDLVEWKDPDNGETFGLREPEIPSYLAPEYSPIRPAPKPESWADLVPSGYKKVMQHNRPNDTAVAAIFGFEADSYINEDDYWRMGYSYPLQLTNWAMAMAPHHPIASGFLTGVAQHIEREEDTLDQIDPLSLTGPPKFTETVKVHCEWDGARTNKTFRWEALSGRNDPPGGRGKVAAGDILILPITGFSPGRTNFFPRKNMGSQDITHPQARVYHSFAGTWRHTSLKVEVGKMCRTLFGLCRDWSKVP